MSALNKSETESLRNIRRLMAYIARNGYDPKKDTEVTKGLKDADSLLNAVIQMKGYYPK